MTDFELLYRFRDDQATPQPARVAPGKVPTSAKIFRAARDGNGVAAGADDAVARASSSSGSPLPDSARAKFEPSLGADLSAVRVHTGASSADAAAAVGAKAYTIGNDIHFADGQYSLDPFGIHLLAHEVAHTQQQAGGTPHRQNKLEVSAPGDVAEIEADRAADAMVAGASFALGAAPIHAARKPGAGSDSDKVRNDINVASAARAAQELNEIYWTLDEAIKHPTFATDDPHVVLVTIAGEELRVPTGDVPGLQEMALKAWQAVNPTPQGSPIDAAKTTGKDDASLVRKHIQWCVDNKDEDALDQLKQALLGAGSTSDDKSNARFTAGKKITFGDTTVTLTLSDISMLLPEIENAHDKLNPNINEVAGSAGVRVDSAFVSFQLAGDKRLYRASAVKFGIEFNPELRTQADTTVMIKASTNQLTIDFSPAIVLVDPATKTASLTRIRIPFVTAKPQFDITTSGIGADPTDQLKAALTTEVTKLIQGTPMATPNYNPMTDRDLEGTYAAVQHNLTAYAAAPSDPNHAGDITKDDVGKFAAGGHFATTQVVALADGQVVIPSGTQFDVVAHAQDKPGAMPTGLQDVVMRSGPVSLMSGKETIATLKGVTVHRGGSVTIADQDLALAGTAGTLDTLERIFKLGTTAAQAHEAGATDAQAKQAGLDRALHDKTMVHSMLEDEMSKAVRGAIRSHRNAIPGVDLAAVTGIQ